MPSRAKSRRCRIDTGTWAPSCDGDHDAGRDIGGRIVAGGDLLALAQDALAARHVVVVDLGRRRHRGVGEAQGRGVEFVAVDDVERVGRFGEADDVLGAVGKVADHDRGQRVRALQPHQVAGIEGHADDIDAGTMRDQRPPMAAVRRRERRRGDAKVDRIALVGEDEELIAAIEDGVADAGLARRHEAGRGVRLAKGRSASARRFPGCRWRRCRSGRSALSSMRVNQPLSFSS